MGLEALREEVCEANIALAASGLVTLAFGNASGVDRDAGVLVIKPSGVPYDRLQAKDMCVVTLDDELVVEGRLRPSSDTPTHAVLYRQFPTIGGVVHTHSTYATVWAQAGQGIPAFGTTHADHFNGTVPVTDPLTPAQVDGRYERETGEAVIETFRRLGLDALSMPAVLVRSHGPFTWGPTASAAVTNAIALEAVAAMAYRTLALDPDVAPIDDRLRRRHFERKHGPSAYYGQAQGRVGRP